MVWVFNGSNSRFCGAVFIDRENAEKWIRKYQLSGILTLYPLDESVYDWSIKEGFFSPVHDHEKSSEFIQKFTSASQEHYHYENGVLE